MTTFEPAQVQHLQELLRWYRHDGWVRFVDVHKLLGNGLQVFGVWDQEYPWCSAINDNWPSSLSPDYNWSCARVDLGLLLEAIAQHHCTDVTGLLLMAEETG